MYIVDLLESNCFPRTAVWIDNRQWRLCPSPSVLQPCLFWDQWKSSWAAWACAWSLVSRWCLGINPTCGVPGRSFVQWRLCTVRVLCWHTCWTVPKMWRPQQNVEKHTSFEPEKKKCFYVGPNLWDSLNCFSLNCRPQCATLPLTVLTVVLHEWNI